MIAMIIIDILYFIYIVYVYWKHKITIKSMSTVNIKIKIILKCINNDSKNYYLVETDSEKNLLYICDKQEKYNQNDQVEVYKFKQLSKTIYSKSIRFNTDLIILLLVELLLIITTIFVYIVK